MPLNFVSICVKDLLSFNFVYLLNYKTEDIRDLLQIDLTILFNFKIEILQKWDFSKMTFFNPIL